MLKMAYRRRSELSQNGFVDPDGAGPFCSATIFLQFIFWSLTTTWAVFVFRESRCLLQKAELLHCLQESGKKCL